MLSRAGEQSRQDVVGIVVVEVGRGMIIVRFLQVGTLILKFCNIRKMDFKKVFLSPPEEFEGFGGRWPL